MVLTYPTLDLYCANSWTFHSTTLVVKQNFSEDKDVAAELQCVIDTCKYPETCRWNKRCMEHGMRVSKEAKMAREKAIRRDSDEETPN